MKEFPVILLLIICLAIIVWSFYKQQRIYQFPFLVAIAFTGFIVPQGFGIYNQPGYVDPYALDMTMVMAILCVSCCWTGYLCTKPSYKFLSTIDFKVSIDKLFQFGIIYSIIGSIFFVFLGNLPTNVLSQTWSGVLVIYNFFAQLAYLGFSLLLVSTLRKPSAYRWICCGLASTWPLIRLVFFGRRTEAAILASIIFASLFLVRRFFIPRKILVTCLVLGVFFIYGIEGYRSLLAENIQDSGNQKFTIENVIELAKGTTQIDWIETFQKTFGGQQISELRYAASLIEVTYESGQYGFGTIYWNRLINAYVPSQFLGRDFKNSLLIRISDISDLIQEKEVAFSGLTVTSVGELFHEFWFFGAFIYCLISSFFKQIWILAFRYYNAFYQILYTLILPLAFITVVDGTSGFLQQLVYYLFFLFPVLSYSRFEKK